jgi:hypothetical protein
MSAPTPCDAGALGQRVSERSQTAANGTRFSLLDYGGSRWIATHT